VSLQSVIARCDAAECVEVTDLITPASRWLMERRDVGTHRIIMHFCPVHAALRTLVAEFTEPEAS
jgi:hypothetical protein